LKIAFLLMKLWLILMALEMVWLLWRFMEFRSCTSANSILGLKREETNERR